MEDEGYEYILGVNRRNNNLSEELSIKQISSKEEQFAKEIYKKEIERNKKIYTRRYILCLNSQTRKDRLETLKTIKMSVSENLRELQEKYKSSQKPSHRTRKMTRDGLMNKADMIVGKNKRIFKVWFDEIKNFLDVRPIGHYKERRVEAHVFVCVLSFLCESIIERFSCESGRKILRKLERIRIISLSADERDEDID